MTLLPAKMSHYRRRHKVQKNKLKTLLIAASFALAVSSIPAIPAHGAPPATPTITSVVESTNAAFDAGTLTVNWDAVATATSYSAMLTKQNSADSPTVITNEDATQRQATFRGLRGGTVYIVQVKAFTGVEASAWSTNTRTAIPKTFPKAPAKPTVVKGVGRATVSWTALLVSERGGYDVSAYIVSKVGSTIKVEVSGTATSAIVTGLSNGSENEFTVTAVTAAGATGSTSDQSDKITLDDVPSTPATPRLETTANSGELKSSWDPPTSNNGSDLVSYTVKILKDGVDLVSKVVTKLSDTFETFTGLLSGKYTTKVLATNEIGNSADSALSNEITIGATASAAPSASPSPSSTASPVPSASPSPSASASVSPSPTVAPAPPSGGGGGGGGGGFGGGFGGGGALPAAVVPLVSPSATPSGRPSLSADESESPKPTAAPTSSAAPNSTTKPSATAKPTSKPSGKPTTEPSAAASAIPSPTALPKIAPNTFFAPVQVTAATQKVSAAAKTITATITPNKPISIAVPAVKKGTAVSIKMRTPDGKLISVTNTKTTKSGTYTMPALSFKKPGKYSIVAKIGNTLKTITITVKK
jgi:hypothetical protein